MKIYHAVTLAPLTLQQWQDDTPHAFPAGTAVTAILWSPERCHLNAEYAGEFYAGYARPGELQLGDVAATVNEG
jgi:hypothetical protein